MLSPDYFASRWSWYRPIFNRGEVPSGRCRVDVRRLPVRIHGEDAREYIPYAIHPQISKVFNTSIQHLLDYATRYMINGEKVSGHQLPQLDVVSREMAGYLRKRYPHLPQALIHHWCGDEHGAVALFQTWLNMWKQSWKQDQADTAPWVAAVNVLMLKLIREAIGRQSSENPAHTDHITVCMVGGLFDWAVKRFLKQHLEGAVEVTRITTYEAMIIPMTPIAFLYRQPDDSLLADDRHVTAAYALEAELVPRMRVLREKVGPKNEAGILALLAQDRMGEHLLKRSWARLSLWEMAEKSGQGIWMQWVLDARKLDQLIARPETLPDQVARQLEPLRKDHPLAGWILDMKAGGKTAKKAGTPWLKDDRVLMAFRVFEEDVKVEIARRNLEKLWLDQASAAATKGKGVEAAFNEGKLVFFQPDFQKSLHSGTSLSAKLACMRIEWSDFLAAMLSANNDYSHFLEKVFLPGVMNKVTGKEGLYLDSCSASGALLRGSVTSLVQAVIALQSQLATWLKEAKEVEDDFRKPSLSACIAMVGDWDFARVDVKGGAPVTLAFGLAVTQASSGLSRECATGRLIAYRDQKLGKKGLGGVRVERVETGTGHGVNLLYNNGIAMTASVVSELTSSMRHRASVRELRVDPSAFEAVMSDYRYPIDSMELVVITPTGDEINSLVLVKAGKVCLGSSDIDLYELMDRDAIPTQLIMAEGLNRWQ